MLHTEDAASLFQQTTPQSSSLTHSLKYTHTHTHTHTHTCGTQKLVEVALCKLETSKEMSHGCVTYIYLLLTCWG